MRIPALLRSRNHQGGRRPAIWKNVLSLFRHSALILMILCSKLPSLNRQSQAALNCETQ